MSLGSLRFSTEFSRSGHAQQDYSVQLFSTCDTGPTRALSGQAARIKQVNHMHVPPPAPPGGPGVGMISPGGGGATPDPRQAGVTVHAQCTTLPALPVACAYLQDRRLFVYSQRLFWEGTLAVLKKAVAG